MTDEPLQPRIEKPGFALCLSQLRLWEAQMLATHPHGALVERAGAALAQLATQMLQQLSRSSATHVQLEVLGLAGPGHNGQDTRACLRRLQRSGWLCNIVEGLDAQTLAPLPEKLPAAGLVVDGWLGIGRNRALSAALTEAIAVLSAWRDAAPDRRRILAVDLPTGLDPDRGVGDPVAVSANATLALLAPTRGLFSPAGRMYAGEVFAAPLVEVVPEDPGHRLIRTARDFDGLALAGRAAHAHKGMLGELVLVGGAEGTEGAIALAAGGALALSPGKIHVVARSERLSLSPQMMRRTLAWLAQKAANATPARLVIGIGCGLGLDDEAEQILDLVLKGSQDRVFDADALNLLARRKDGLKRMKSGPGQPITSRVVLTPHPLEAARLLGVERKDVENNRHAAAQTLVADSGATVVLKGAGTLVASPDGACDILDLAAPALAQAGSGDVLSGVLCALLALHPSLPLQRLAAAAVYLHAEAARRWSVRTGQLAGLSMDTLSQEISRVFAELDAPPHLRPLLGCLAATKPRAP
jgi:hydroxyethylthiazole kinase-like uncharacterized protein yjeF